MAQPAAGVEDKATGLIRGLGLLDSTMIVAGSMIGSGIFIVSADIARHVGSAGGLILTWVITGILTITAALSYGELAAMMPAAGGQYVYLREAYSPLWGFLYGWTLFLVIQTGTIAAVAVAFAKFTAVLIPWFSEKNILLSVAGLNISAGQVLAIASIAVCLAFVIVDLGRPDRFWHMLPFIGRFNWPISMLTWDVLVLNIYFVLNIVIVTLPTLRVTRCGSRSCRAPEPVRF